MKAKRWMSVWLCAALVMALTGCGANADPAGRRGASQTSAAKVVKLRVWADKEEYDLTTQLADQFQKDNSGTVKLNISVEPKEQVTADQCDQGCNGSGRCFYYSGQ